MGFNSSQVGDDFNPRSHEGSDCKKKWYGAVLILISIHAPTKGATSENSSIIVSFHDFNPRSHEGSDLPLRRTYNKLFQFQSTLPRRERPKIIRKRCAWSQISIHAPTKGATYPKVKTLSDARFQSTLPRRERPEPCSQTASVVEFQSTLPRRERQQFYPILHLIFFNFH